MEIFFWQKNALCSKYHQHFPKENYRVTVKMPLLSPEAVPGTICLCQNYNCPIFTSGICSSRATFIETSPSGAEIAGTITPEQHSIFRRQPVPTNLSLVKI